MIGRQSSSQWSDGIAAYPALKYSESKNLLENFLSRFFGISTASSSLSSKGPNYQRGVLLISAGAVEGHFERKNRRAAGSSPRTMPRFTGHLQPRRKLAFQCLDHLPYSSDLAPSDYHLFPGLKRPLKCHHFFVRHGGHCCRGDLIVRTNF
jgi:hypothetical protein